MADFRYYALVSVFLFIVTFVDSFPKTNDEEDNENIMREIITPAKSKHPKQMQILLASAHHPGLVTTMHALFAKYQYNIDKLIPDFNKVVFFILLTEPLTAAEVTSQLTEAVAKHTNLDLDSIQVSKYDPYTGVVKMFFLHTIRQINGTRMLQLRPASEIVKSLTVKKRLKYAGDGIKIMDILDGDEFAHHYHHRKKVSVQNIFSDKNWEAWQLGVLISAGLFAIFCFLVVFMFLSTHRLSKNKVGPIEEPRQVIVQPILRPAVAGIGVIQPLVEENRELHVAPTIDTDSEHTPSPSRSPMRRGRGLLERRGSNASLTLDLNHSQENIHCGTPPKECSAGEFLQSASKRLTRRQLRSVLKDVKALHTEFWEIPMNHPEKVEVAGSGTKNRYKTILPNETSRVHLYEKSGDPLSSYINANYVRGYGGEAKAYIAAQGPLPHTVDDFWLMVWKEKSPLIVMITKLKEKLKVKCEPYIPDYQDRYGDVEVTVTRVIPRDGYTVRELFLRRGSETHTVHHFWYTTWPDHKTPATAKQLLSMSLEAESMRIGDARVAKGPMVVHCSAGIGRTGCFIAVSIGIQQLLEENTVDVLGTVCSLRLDRGGMIQTAEQYEFVHQALSIFECTMPGASVD